MKVVPISKYTGTAKRAAPSKSLRILYACRDRFVEHLLRIFPRMMDKVDDALFAMADKAESNTLQTTYFEAMRELRIKRPGMESEFRRELVAGIDARIDPRGRSHASGELADALASDLTLVEKDELEESLAVTNMVARIRNECKRELYGLDKRMAALLGDTELPSSENPVGPEVVCAAFRDACGAIESGIEVKLVVLKLFDRYVVSEMSGIYQDINHHLVSQDVLPEIRASVRRTPGAGGGHRARGAAGRTTAPGAEADATPDGGPATSGMPSPANAAAAAPGQGTAAGGEDLLYVVLQQLMDMNAASAASAEPGLPPSTGGDVVAGLTQIQHGNVTAVLGEHASLDAAGLAAGTTNVLRSLKSAPFARNLGQFDGAIIDIVAMMFDFILDERGIPDPMKALIGRLQIPVVKVAMLDREFFARRFHPARRLLNTLADAAVGWNETREGDDRLLEVARRVVHRVLREFVDDVAVFAEALEELETFLAEEERRADEQAEEMAEDLEAREKLRQARELAAAEVEARLASQEVPSFLRSFLADHWQELLSVTAFQAGTEGGEWRGAVETMDDLIWSVLPKDSAEERQWLVSALPGLIERLNAGIQRTAMSAEERSRLLAEFSDYHAAAVRRPSAPGSRSRSAEPQPESVMQPEAEQEAGRECAAAAAPEEPRLGAQSYALEAAIQQANALIHATAVSRPECAGMGTTLVAALFHGEQVSVAHVGDARVYRLRGERFEQLTRDHSLVQQLIDLGFYTPEEAQCSVRKNVVTRALGVDEEVEPGLQELVTEAGDIYLLCSDGLSDMVTDAAIHEVLQAHPGDLEGAVDALVTLANDHGGKDNISVILVTVDALPAGAEEVSASREGAQAPVPSLRIARRTDVGRKRSHNEDALGGVVPAGLLLVADGMGGCNAGEVASSIAVTTVLEAFSGASPDDAPDAPQAPEQGAFRIVFGPVPAEPEEAASAADAEASGAGAGGSPDEDFEVEEITLSGEAGLAEVEDIEDEFTEQARALEVGSWVEFRQFDGSCLRARLAWTSPVTGTYLFTNRTGSKVAERTPRGLAVELRRGTARVLDDIPLFERAVSSLSMRLRRVETVH